MITDFGLNAEHQDAGILEPMIDPKLLEILACPACDDRPPVQLEGEGLRCDRCGRIYPIRDGIPEMLVESATLSHETPAPTDDVTNSES